VTIQLEFRKSGIVPTARIVLNGFSTLSGLPSVTPECATMGELKNEIQLVEAQLRRILDEARQKFLAAGISK
jgi:hypothetical protein